MLQSDHKSASSYVTTIIFLIYYYLYMSLASNSQVVVSSSQLDTLKPGDVLNSTSRLVSARNIFTLGFHTPAGTNNSYIAIWYTNGYYSPVWIGNRVNPVLANSRAVLTINSSGSLFIARQGIGHADDRIELYSSLSSSSRNVSATLLDSGNFVVKDMMINSSLNGSAGEEVILWQSVDHPTDTLLPGMKLGMNHRTGRNWTLVSWFGQSNPAPGPFSLEWDGWRLIVRRRGVAYWTSGELRDCDDGCGNLRVKAFENIEKPDIANLNYNFTSYSSENEEYFMYFLIKDPFLARRSVISGWMLQYQGELYDNDRPIIARVGLCYGHNTWGDDNYRGCELWEQPKCRKLHQTFVLRSGDFTGRIGRMVRDGNSNLSLSDCREHCWNDCECVGYSERESGCDYWRGVKLRFEQSLAGTSARLYVLDSPASEKRGKRLMGIILGVAMFIVLLLLLAALFLRRRFKQRKWQEKMHELLTLEGYTEACEHENGGSKGHDLRLFTYAAIIAATNNFSSDYKLGEGGFGPVYKGKTPEGQEIAVKLLSRKSGQGLLEFKTELILISKLQHVNLVKLHGFCIRGGDKMIVYDYMPNKSLDFYLFDPLKREELNWGRRLNIIEGIAQGLLYLHKYSRLSIVHRDLKSSNILLDKNLNPKISDFGLARIFKQNTSEENTNRRVGTYGYMAPEYAMQGIFSYKSDVYSFGVLVLEIVSGRKNSSFRHIEGPLNLVEYAWELWNNNSALELMDQTLRSSCIIDQVQRCINIALLCVENRAVDRPDIEDVISMLRNETLSLPLPKNPAFITRNGVVEELEKSTPEKLSSANEITISEIEGR